MLGQVNGGLGSWGFRWCWADVEREYGVVSARWWMVGLAVCCGVEQHGIKGDGVNACWIMRQIKRKKKIWLVEAEDPLYVF